MKQFTLLAALAAAVVGTSAIAGAVRANEMAEEAVENVQTHDAEEQTLAHLNQITAEELQTLIDTSDDLVIIDARRVDEFVQGHIPGAIALTPSEATPERLAELAPTKNTPMVFYCGSVKCPASAKAAHQAAEHGYTKLYKYAGGIADWREKGLPVATD